jgi:hypothetical protein
VAANGRTQGEGKKVPCRWHLSYTTVSFASQLSYSLAKTFQVAHANIDCRTLFANRGFKNIRFYICVQFYQQHYLNSFVTFFLNLCVGRKKKERKFTSFRTKSSLFYVTTADVICSTSFTSQADLLLQCVIWWRCLIFMCSLILNMLGIFWKEQTTQFLRSFKTGANFPLNVCNSTNKCTVLIYCMNYVIT